MIAVSSPGRRVGASALPRYLVSMAGRRMTMLLTGMLIADMLIAGMLFTGLLGCGVEAEAPSASAPLPPVQLKAGVDKADAVVGETVTYTVTLDHDPALQVDMPDVFSKLDGVIISDIRREGPTRKDGRTWYQQKLTLQALQAGSFLLPALEVRWKDASGQEQTAGAPQIFLEVKSSLNETDAEEDISDIKDIVPPPPDYTRLALLGALAAGVLGLGVGAYLWWKRRKKAAIPPPPPPPPWEVALQALAQLTAENRLEQGDPEAGRLFAFALSELTRRYVEDQFNLPALEASTEEVLGQLHRSRLPDGKPRGHFRALLLATDRVKFAKAPVTAEEGQSWLALARELVELTRPVEPLAPEAAAGPAGTDPSPAAPAARGGDR